MPPEIESGEFGGGQENLGGADAQPTMEEVNLQELVAQEINKAGYDESVDGFLGARAAQFIDLRDGANVAAQADNRDVLTAILSNDPEHLDIIRGVLNCVAERRQAERLAQAEEAENKRTATAFQIEHLFRNNFDEMHASVSGIRMVVGEYNDIPSGNLTYLFTYYDGSNDDRCFEVKQGLETTTASYNSELAHDTKSTQEQLDAVKEALEQILSDRTAHTSAEQ